MGIIGILSSPSSFLKNDEMNKIRSVISSGSGIFHYEVEKHQDITEALMLFQQSDIDLIVILGDRALTSAVFEHIIEKNILSRNIPLAILPAGDNNIIAESFGAHQSEPHIALRKLLLDYHHKENFLNKIIECSLIKIEGVRGVGHLYGLFFCAGEIVKQKSIFNRKILGQSFVDYFRRKFKVIGLIQSAYRSALSRNKLKDAIRINRNQRGAVMGHFFMLSITTLDKSLWGIALDPLKRKDSAHFISVENTPESIMRVGKEFFKGHYETKDVAGHIITDINHARLVLQTAFVLDGSYYEACDSGEILITIMDRLKFIRLS